MILNICVEREREISRKRFPFIKNCEIRLIVLEKVEKSYTKQFMKSTHAFFAMLPLHVQIFVGSG